MPAIVALPQVVEALLLPFGDCFPTEPARVHFAEYLTGLLVAEHKPISGLARAFAAAPDQACLNRWLTESVWDVARINAHRLAWLQQDPATRYRHDGVITDIGDRKFNRPIVVRGQETTVSTWVTTLGSRLRTTFTVGGHTQWSCTTSMRIPKVNHPVRILVLWSAADATDPRKVLVTNRTYWEAHRIRKVSTRRWTGTEADHRDGKQHVGMGDGQRRDGMGQTYPLHRVMLVYTARMRQLTHDRALEWAHIRLLTIGESGRAIARETLAWAIERA